MGITFACRELDIDEIIRCGLNLSKSEMKIFKESLKESNISSNNMAKRLNLDRTTIQKGLGKLLEKGLIRRVQMNRDNGGYEYRYQSMSKEDTRNKVKEIASEWFKMVEVGLEKWTI